ncbi:hypothetical protein KIH24_07850 [Rhizobiales bacterium TNE-4]|nr:hypothetical protein [Rhizobiales bacterium TNE-4]MBV1827537.1 hypothetical protein [Rhizobiales bacterium TNE-4]
MRRFFLSLPLVFTLAGASLAHEPRPGPHGGLKVDAGSSMHAELVADGTVKVTVFLYDANDKPVAAQGFRANAILIVDGSTQRFALQAAESNKLVGNAPVAVPKGVKGAVQIIGPDGAAVQAKF